MVSPVRASNSKAQRQAPPSAAPQPRARLVALRALASNRWVRKEAKSCKATWMENGWKMDEWWSSHNLMICSFTSVGVNCHGVHLFWIDLRKKKLLKNWTCCRTLLSEYHLFLLPTQMIGGIIWWTKKMMTSWKRGSRTVRFSGDVFDSFKTQKNKGLQGSK